jgi:hypothetical protein
MPRLTPREVEALQCALDLAYQGWATADQVIRQYGKVRPFSRIRAAEQGRIHQLWRLFVAHGLPIPPNPWTGGVNSPASLADACGQALEQEQARLKRYGQLLVCTDQEELRQVFRAQAEASELRHGPAYGRCGQCRNTQSGGCPDGPSRPPSAPPRRCVARSHQDWLWTE